MGLEGLEGPKPPEISLQAIAGLRTPQSMRVQGLKAITIFIDSGSAHMWTLLQSGWDSSKYSYSYWSSSNRHIPDAPLEIENEKQTKLKLKGKNILYPAKSESLRFDTMALGGKHLVIASMPPACLDSGLIPFQ